MMRNSILATLVLVVLACGSGIAMEPIRIDGSSDASTEASWNKMLAQASPRKQRLLTAAMFKLNMAGVTSAYQVVDNPKMRSIGILAVSDKVSGLTAVEIINLADRISTVKVETK